MIPLPYSIPRPNDSRSMAERGRDDMKDRRRARRAERRRKRRAAKIARIDRECLEVAAELGIDLREELEGAA